MMHVCRQEELQKLVLSSYRGDLEIELRWAGLSVSATESNNRWPCFFKTSMINDNKN